MFAGYAIGIVIGFSLYLIVSSQILRESTVQNYEDRHNQSPAGEGNGGG
jgi:hypothetical protein